MHTVVVQIKQEQLKCIHPNDQQNKKSTTNMLQQHKSYFTEYENRMQEHMHKDRIKIGRTRSQPVACPVVKILQIESRQKSQVKTIHSSESYKKF